MTLYQISNGHASATAPAVIYDPDDDAGNMLVACVLANTSSMMLDALKAEFEKNSGNHLKAIPDDPNEDTIALTAAGRGYAHAKMLFTRANATGQARAHLHPLAGDPRLHPKVNYFYVVVETGQDPAVKFGERLQLATYHTILPQWYRWLLEQGYAELVELLPMLGNHFFTTAFRVSKDNDAWGELISQGLRTGAIHL